VKRVLGAVLMAALLMGCGGGGGKTANGPVTVTFWEFFPTETVRPLVEAFEAEHPDIQVELQQLTWQSGQEKITAAAAAGNPPDLCELGSTWFAKFAGNGTLADLTAYADSLRPDYRMWDACTYDGRIYGLPWVIGTRALFVNVDLMRRAGLDPDHLPETWDDLLVFAAKVNALGDQIYGYGLNSGERYVQFKKFMPFAWGNGGTVLSPDGRRCAFNEPPVLEALRFYLKLKPYSLLEKQEVLDQAFKDGRIGAMISGSWMLRTIPRDAPDLNYAVALVPRPAPERGSHASFGGGEVLVVFRRSPRQEAALELARYLIGARQAMVVAKDQMSVLPAAVSAEKNPYFTENPKMAVFMDQLRTAVFPPNVESWLRIEDVVDASLEKAVFGKVEPDAALDEACRAIDAILAEPAQ
jgi:multiple sugar transport system substrate-binding protein